MRALALFTLLLASTDIAGAQTATSSAAYARALQLEATDKYRDAAIAYREALRGEPGNLAAMLGLERAYAQLGWTDSLLALLDTAISARPTDVTLRTIQLRTLRSTRDESAIGAAFEKWHRDAPRDQAPFREYAKLLLQDGRSAAADSVLRRAELLLGSGEGLELESAQIRASMGLWEQSAAAWRKAVTNAPYLEQAAVFSLAPASTASRDGVRRALLAGPALVSARRIGAALELHWGFPRAGWDLLRTLPADSSSVVAWVDFARRAEEAQAWLVARDALMAAHQHTRSSALAARAATDAMNGGDSRSALLLSAAIAADTGAAGVAVLAVRLRALASMGHADEAAHALEEAKNRVPAGQYARLARLVAWGWIRRGDLAKARAHLEASDGEERDDPVYGWLALYEGDLRGARRMLTTHTESAPDLVAALALLARTRADSAPPVGRAFLALARGDTARAIKEFEESARILPETETLLIAMAARLASGARDYTRSIALWRGIAERHPDTPEAPEAELEWARSLRRGGHNSAAIERLEHSDSGLSKERAFAPGSPGARVGPRQYPIYSMMPVARSRFTALCVALMALGTTKVQAQHLLVPMDDEQGNHLKAYGLMFGALKDGLRGEWLLNYRGGSFLLPDAASLRRRAALDGVTVLGVDNATLSEMRAEIASANMDAVPLEKAPRIAVYTPPDAPPWDDAVTLALRYAGIEYTTVWDAEVERGDLAKYDWLHLHHEDFTGQLSKFYISYRGAPWFVEQQQRNLAMARQLGFGTIPSLKKAVAERMRQFVENGGFIFAMCGATETLELAMAGRAVDIAGSFGDGTPIDESADAKMAWQRSFAFRDARLELSPFTNAMSDIDGHQVNVPGRRQPLGTFTLFGFSAKFDPVASMLVQDHRTVIADFYGVTTSFTRRTLKPGVTVLAEEEGAPWVKYLHGDYGKGSWTYLGGHDPEDPQHSIGNPPTDLSLHPHSPGYRLILNNVLFPAAKKKPLKT